MNDDRRAYRQTLGTFATGVCVVTIGEPGNGLGLTINSFTSVSLDPRLILWCLDYRSDRFAAYSAASTFRLHILSEAQQALSERFAFGDAAIGADETDLFDGALGQLDCRVHQRLDVGDHQVMIGEVVTFNSRPGAPLLYVRGQYGQVKSA
ncbi:MAG: flavin reductase family protein [Asticcacaulis sp.]